MEQSYDDTFFDLLDVVELYCRREVRRINAYVNSHQLVHIDELRRRKDCMDLLSSIEGVHRRYWTDRVLRQDIGGVIQDDDDGPRPA